MRVRFWGVRGSYPVPGPSTNRYGGNTSCVHVLPDSGSVIIIDAGTGIRKLGKELMKGVAGQGKGMIHLLISHTHWDHIQGLPFFAPLHRKGNTIYVYSLHRNDTHLKHVFRSATEDPYFPVSFDAAKATVEFVDLEVGSSFSIDDVEVECTRLNHPWIAMAYRLNADESSLVYVSDTAPFKDLLLQQEYIPAPPGPDASIDPKDARLLGSMRKKVVHLCRSADMVIYDTHFTEQEYLSRPHWGHSAPVHALDLLTDAHARTLVLFHHAPEHGDDQMDSILEHTRELAAGKIKVLCAMEGQTLDVKTGERI